MQALVTFMQSQFGRGARILLGLVLIYLGVAVVGGAAGWVIAIVDACVSPWLGWDSACS